MIVKTNGGLSVISAFVDGIGSAISLDLPMYTTVIESDSDKIGDQKILETLEIIRNKYSINKKYSVEIKSQIPQSVGLKSSSAMTLSLLYAILRLNRIYLKEDELLRSAAEISLKNKTSITGALDDISMCYYGGLTVTDNFDFRLIRRIKIENTPVIIAYPKFYHRSTYDMKDIDFKKYKKYIQKLELLLNSKYVYETMVLNGYLFGSLFGYDPEIINYFLGSGAIFSGISGKGPAVFAIYEDNEDRDNAASKFSYQNYNIIKSRINNDGINIIYQ
ncbi:MULTISPECIES: shikimate kinase [Acidiplasma]|jgi:shikimate kinase|uniref:Shikimate kinase n=3 Tax=Acidiplasma TaxID=507753 RepID=A0A0Q0VV03_9ARCH|nr:MULTISPECIES: shikimate kinase [Acidiplasma]KQB35462.1 hypothetical protein AOG55_06700 [Acidiplasma cupricumulans]KQB35781.1 hypothetical protein AOG54_08540 [Acidiplasma aeolicum]